LLKGPLSDRIAFHPYDGLTRKLEDADALLRGRFRLAGHMIEVREGSIFDKPAPTPDWAEALHSFQWLPPLSAAGGDAARTLAMNLFTQWLRRSWKYGEPSWLPHVMARRLANTFAHGRLILTNSDVLWRSRVFVSLREQSRMLAWIAREAPEGLARLEAASVVALSAVCLDHSKARLLLGLKLLEEELGKQILADGGHVSRSPSQLAHAYRLLTMVIDALAAENHETPKSVRSAHDRMAPMLRFFQHGDGGLAQFNGGDECDARMIAGLLARDEVRGQPLGYARHSGYHRLAAGSAVVLMDCGPPPPIGFANSAHAGCLSFEMSTGQQRVVVNCGTAGPGLPKWEDALCATAAHSTLTLADTSAGTVLPRGLMRDLVGRRLVGGASNVESRRTEVAGGERIDAVHNGYEMSFGIRHERQVVLLSDGLTLAGQDRVIPVSTRGPRAEAIPFAVRFHVHPDVRVSPSQGGDFLLKLPDGAGWRFRVGGAQVGLEESVYLGDGTVRRTEQLVLTSAVKDAPVQIGWTFEQIGAACAASKPTLAVETSLGQS
jgi:uncharacterized heparinase superfamily protein